MIDLNYEKHFFDYSFFSCIHSLSSYVIAIKRLMLKDVQIIAFL